MKKEHFEESLQCGKKAFEQIKQKNAHFVATDCPLAAIQIKQGAELKELPMHPIQILARAYKSKEEGGFSKNL
jgi:Fe-S oxidoreductase